ncbi:MAG TPA: 50S ribosome-binding GTPase, partial [Tepidisphaeraceae bacterium]|nr:50S ribosome-binding GTPase [Tepidisphaeraceae bacterium]
PNAGKSTLLAMISAARPKIADYPFTTLEPQLGIAELDLERRIVFADIPGLIEGAHEGSGLGHAFLRHIERCRLILHMLDLFPTDGSNPYDNYTAIRHELEQFSPELANKPELIIANKIDLAPSDDHEVLEALREKLQPRSLIAISGATKQGLPVMLEEIWKRLHPRED